MIAIDFREGARAKRAGKGQYVYELVLRLVTNNPTDHFILLTHADQVVSLPGSNWTQQKFSSSPLLWHPQVLWWLAMQRNVTCYLSTTSTIVPALHIGCRVVTTLFDFSVVRYPATHLKKAVLFERLCLPLAIRRSAHLLAISQATAEEAQELYHIPTSKVTVTPLAASPEFKPLELSAETMIRLQETYGLPQKFILYLGTLEPRKNISRLIAAYRQIQPQFPEHKLVLAGSKGWIADSELELSEDVVTTGFIADADRPALYNLASIFVFPSLYEGFGMPPLEAMSCGTPVITSNVSSLPEVVGAAALTVEPLDTDAIAEAMKRLLGDETLRHELSDLGLERAHLFSWDITADLTLKVLKRYA